MDANTSSSAFPSMLAGSKYGNINVPPQLDMILDAVTTASPWTIILTILAMCVVYDQSTCFFFLSPQLFNLILRCTMSPSGHTTLRYRNDGESLLTWRPCAIVSYLMNKGSIVGPAWKMPFIGPFLQSMNPKFEEYYAKWASGPLSCVSVFHKYVCIQIQLRQHLSFA